MIERNTVIDREQELIDLVFAMAIVSAEFWSKREYTPEEMDRHTEWIRKKLKFFGFEVEPMGSSHGVLKR